MLIDLLVTHPWLAAATWALLYLCDHIMTHAFARRYLALRAEERPINYQGGIELNPVFEKEVLRQRWLSPRFLAMLVLMVGAILVLSILEMPPVFEILIGAVIMEWIFLDTRHLQNLLVLRDLLRPGNVVGRIEYSYRFNQRNMAYSFFVAALLYALISLASSRLFFAGGAAASALLAIRHFRLANRKLPSPETTTGELASSAHQPEAG